MPVLNNVIEYCCCINSTEVKKEAERKLTIVFSELELTKAQFLWSLSLQQPNNEEFAPKQVVALERARNGGC